MAPPHPFAPPSADARGTAFTTHLRNARAAANLHPEQLAAAVGISRAWYHDLESYPNNLTGTLSLEQLRRLAEALQVDTAAIFGVGFRRRVPLRRLPELIRAHLALRAITAAKFEDAVGYEVAPCLTGSAAVMEEWNVDCLYAVCREIGLDWIEVLP